jgi:energy-coupling factor transport system permease protein
VILDNPLNLFILFAITLLGFILLKPPLFYIKIVSYLIVIALVGTSFSQGFFYYFEPKTVLFTILPKDFGFLGRITGGIYLYKEGLIYGLIQSLRLFSIILICMIIVMTTHPSDLILGLNKLGLSEKIGFMLTVSIRFLPDLIEEAKRILIAQKLRGVKLKGIKGSFKAFGYLLLPLLINNLRKASRLSLAAQVRGFCGKRRPVKTIKFKWFDWIIFMILLIAIVLAIRYRRVL